jgi:hypothetical protein
MDNETFEGAMRLFQTGACNVATVHLLAEISRLSECSTVMLVTHQGSSPKIVASLGVPYSLLNMKLSDNAKAVKLMAPGICSPEPQKQPDLRQYPFDGSRKYWSYFAAVPIYMQCMPYPIHLVCCDERTNIGRQPSTLITLTSFAEIVADMIRMIEEITLHEAPARVSDLWIGWLKDGSEICCPKSRPKVFLSPVIFC